MTAPATLNRQGYPDLPGFQPVRFDFAQLHWLPDDPWQPDPETPHYYEVKARIAAAIKPKRVVEIGVRAGYSALAFYQGHPFSEFYGMDIDQGSWGGVTGYLAKADERLKALGIRYELAKGDSQLTKTLPPDWRNADLFHVDGNHTPMGTAHDIILGLHNGARYIVVDDYDATHHVADGADWVVRTFGLDAWYVGDGGYRGNVIIARPATPRTGNYLKTVEET